jgi:hypothetical protein
VLQTCVSGVTGGFLSCFRPVKAVVLLYPDCEGLEGENEEEDTRIANDGQPHLLDQADGTVLLYTYCILIVTMS